MAHNTRPLKRAQDGVAPQYYNPTTDEYEVLLGQDGAARAILYGPNGQPITNESPLEVRVRQLETLLGALDAAKETNPDAASATLLALIRGLMSAAAKETTLEAIKSTDGIKKIADAVTVSGLENLATETKLEAVRTLVEDLKSELILVKANQLSGDQKVQLSGRNATSVNAFNALAITDTALKLSGDLPIFRTHPHKAIIVLNSLDNSVTIRLYSNSVGGDHLTVSGIAVGSHLPRVITAADAEFAMLDVLFSSNINIQIAAVCSTAPTSGSLTVTVVGWF